jgi:glycosyltransferase involved in cell wall biosynthesis
MPGALISNLARRFTTRVRSAAGAASNEPPLEGPTLGVILTTFNPRPELLRQTLECLGRQTLAADIWDLVIVDNNSSPPLETRQCTELAGRPLRVVREPRQGQVFARVRGARATQANVLVFVDDDNFLSLDYLERAREIAYRHPRVGAFGGIAEAILERSPQPWQRPLLPYLAVRDHGNEAITSTSLEFGPWEPIGAGLVVRRTALPFFLQTVDCPVYDQPLGRAANQLLSGDDTLIAKSSIRAGFANSYQPDLRLQHFITSGRFRPAYLRRLIEGYGHSHVKMQRLLGRSSKPPHVRKVVASLRKAFKKRLSREGRAGAIRWYGHVGQLAEHYGLRQEEALITLREARAEMRRLRRAGSTPHGRAYEGDLEAAQIASLVRQAAHLLPVPAPGEPPPDNREALVDAFRLLRRAATIAGTGPKRKRIRWRRADGLLDFRNGRSPLLHLGIGPQTVLHVGSRRSQDALLLAAGKPLLDALTIEVRVNDATVQSHVCSTSAGNQLLAIPLRLPRGESQLQFSYAHSGLDRRPAFCFRRLELHADDTRGWPLRYRSGRSHLKKTRTSSLEANRPESPPTDAPPCRISLVVPCRDAGATLERTLDSILAQDYPNLEIIVMDGGSTDRTPEIIQRYRHHLTRVGQGPDGGQVDALNRGFQSASGDIYGWLCADDELMPGALHAVNAAFQASPDIEVFCGGCERIYPDGSRERTAPPADAWSCISMRNPLEQPSTFWRSELHRRVGSLDERYALVFDWDFWARFAELRARLQTTPRPLSRYHFSHNNKSGSAGNQHALEGLDLVRRYGPRKGLVADCYQILYHFDLLGCMDRTRRRDSARQRTYRQIRSILRDLCGENFMDLYNLHFASLQERGHVWWC